MNISRQKAISFVAILAIILFAAYFLSGISSKYARSISQLALLIAMFGAFTWMIRDTKKED
jgi:uncharacterized protein with PQ loop repeat